MRLVHDAENNLWIIFVLGGKLAPKRCILRVRRSSLTNNLAIPASVIVLKGHPVDYLRSFVDVRLTRSRTTHGLVDCERAV